MQRTCKKRDKSKEKLRSKSRDKSSDSCRNNIPTINERLGNLF